MRESAWIFQSYELRIIKKVYPVSQKNHPNFTIKPGSCSITGIFATPSLYSTCLLLSLALSTSRLLTKASACGRTWFGKQTLYLIHLLFITMAVAPSAEVDWLLVTFYFLLLRGHVWLSPVSAMCYACSDVHSIDCLCRGIGKWWITWLVAWPQLSTRGIWNYIVLEMSARKWMCTFLPTEKYTSYLGSCLPPLIWTFDPWKDGWN